MSMSLQGDAEAGGDGRRGGGLAGDDGRRVDDGRRLGVIAFGDSITNGGGELQWGVALQSWALWTARGLGLPYSPYAVDGASTADVLALQFPRFERCCADPSARYDIGFFYTGANDVRLPGFLEDVYEHELDAGFRWLRARCDRVVTATLPSAFAAPYARLLDRHLIERCNRTIERVARRHGVLVVNLRRFGGRTVMMADCVHPTAFGQIAMAEATLDLLAAEGMTVRVRPWELAPFHESRRGRLQGDITFTYRSAKEYTRAWFAEAVLRVQFRGRWPPPCGG